MDNPATASSIRAIFRCRDRLGSAGARLHSLEASAPAVNVADHIAHIVLGSDDFHIVKGDAVGSVRDRFGPPGSDITVGATVTDIYNNPLPGMQAEFRINGAARATITTNADGHASFIYYIPLGTSVGYQPITVRVAEDASHKTNTDTGTLTVYGIGWVKTALSGKDYTENIGKACTLAAVLTRTDTGGFVGQQKVTFLLDGTQIGSAATRNADGRAAILWTPPPGRSPGEHTLVANFAGAGIYAATSTTNQVTIK